MNVAAIGPISVGSLLWQRNGASTLTVIAKTTFRLTPGTCILSDEQEPLNADDAHLEDDPARSMLAPSDLVPFKARADVVLVGYAFAPRGEPQRQLVVRMNVGEVNKSFEVVCDRAWAPEGVVREGPRFTRMALQYERAGGGPGTANPIGIGPEARGMLPLPNLQPVGFVPGRRGEVIEPVGFGPLSASWPARRARMRAPAPPRNAREASAMLADLEPAYFNYAPADQQLDGIRPDERLLLDHLHPQHPHLATTLPGLRPRAFTHHGEGTQEIALVADTLWIDTARSICAVTWRGFLERPAVDASVVVALEGAHRSLPWTEIQAALRGAGPGSHELVEMDETADEPRERRHTVEISPARAPRAVAADAARDDLAALRDEVTSVSMDLPLGLQAIGDAAPAWLSRAPPPRDQELALETRPRADHNGGPSPMTPARSDYDGGVASKPPPAPSSPSILLPAPGPQAIPIPIPRPSVPSIPPWAVPAPPVIAPSALAPKPVTPSTAGIPSASPSTAGLPSAGLPNGLSGSASLPSTPSSLASAQGAPTSLAQTAHAGVLAASNEAASAGDIVSGSRLSKPDVALQVAASRDLLELVWWHPDKVGALRQHPPWAALVAPRLVAGKRVEPSEPSPRRDLEDVERILLGAAPCGDLDAALVECATDLGAIRPALAVISGEIALPLDDAKMLEVLSSAASSLAAGDKRLKEAVDAAADVLKTPLVAAPEVAAAFCGRVREAWTKSSRMVPPDYLDVHARRILLDQRSFQRRVLCNEEWVRALLALPGQPVHVPTYIPAASTRWLPLFGRFAARVVAEIVPQLDQHEGHPLALRVLALARVISPRTRTRAS
jgi:hypothetical protein